MNKNRIKVGIPRALLYHTYYPMWKSFFEELDCQIVVSEPTSKITLDKGVKNTVDEACLPVKAFVGHVLELGSKVDWVFVPRLISVEERTYICPKFLGLPDMIKHTLPSEIPILEVDVNLYRRKEDIWKTAWDLGLKFKVTPVKVWRALQKSLLSWRLHCEALLEEGKDLKQGLTIALIGHPYNLYDDYINMNLIKRLKNHGINVITPEHVPEPIIQEHAARLPKKLFWSMGKTLIGSAYHLIEHPQVDGMIHIAAFGCGPDSFTGELIERRCRRLGKPILNLNLDEHTGEAGIVTRLEAFIDMLEWRKSQCLG